MAKAIGLAHWTYSQYFNDFYGRTGHLWHSRFYSCVLDEDHRIAALRYVDCNPQRAGLVKLPWQYTWSSASAHCGEEDGSGLLNLDRWFQEFSPHQWREILVGEDCSVTFDELRKRTLDGRPLGSDAFVDNLEKKVGRALRVPRRGRPKKKE